MMPRTLPAAALLTSIAVMTGYAADQWPPTSLRPLAPDAPVLTPEEEMKTFVMPPGYRVELVASEPMIQDPVVIDWDPNGRLWVVEMPGYMIDMTASNELDPTGRIVVLEDTDRDGRMDKRTVFAEDLVLPRAIKVLDQGVLIAEPPNLWLMKDTNNDLKADTREPVTDRYGRREANVEHNANGLLWALDNWMYTSEVDMYLRLKNGTFEVQTTLSRGQWGVSQDDAGRIYRNTNSSALFVDLIPARYFLRHPGLVRTRGLYELLGGAELNETWPIMPTPGVNRGYQTGVLRDDKTLASFTAVNAPTVFRGDRLPADMYGNVFLAEPSGNLVSRVIIEDTGRSLRGRKAYERAEFLASSNERFRPVYMSSAPDGTLYIVDMYHGIIQHKGYITEYLRDQILSRKLEQQIHRGRLWRVVHETTQRGEQPSLQSASPAALVQTLSHPNGWWRDTAQRLLVERGNAAAVAPLTTMAESDGDQRARLHALWALDGIDRLQPSTVIKALGASSRDVRVSGLRLSERFAATDPAVQTAILGRVEDGDWWVRQQLAATLAGLPAERRDTALVTLLERHGDDPVLVDAALSGLRNGESGVLMRLLTAAQTPQKEAAIAMLAATIVRSGQDDRVREVFALIADDQRPEWQRSMLLRGAEVALLGVPAPPAVVARGGGAGGRAGRGPVDDTAPGGRAGPGGAPAFPRGGEAAARGAGGRATPAGGRGADAEAGGARAGGGGRGGRGGGGGQLLMLREAPAALVALASAPGELSQRAAAVLARVGWPGKPGMPAPVAPLSPEEQQRFAAGEQVYKNLCLACHQADGRGLDKVGPPLVESALALATAGVPARIVLNGKEGTTGLMPPLGATMSDADVAAVLTYVRRSWGHTASAVTPAAVAETRKAVAARLRPWTNAELQALGFGGAQQP
jgi:mono/diheme cytochrome c family protein/glucose/arabinose dehydrogenase